MTQEMKKIEDEIKKSLEKIRPSLQADGGDVKFESWDEKSGTVEVSLQGMCLGCPMSQITLKEGIEKTLLEDVTAVKKVVQV